MSRVLCRSGESRLLRETPSRGPHECGGLMGNIAGCCTINLRYAATTEELSSGMDRVSISRAERARKKSYGRAPESCKEASSIWPKHNALAISAAGFLIPQAGSTTGRVSFFIYTVLIRKSTPLLLRNTWHVSIRTIVNSWHC